MSLFSSKPRPAESKENNSHGTVDSEWGDILDIKEETLREWCLNADGRPVRIPDSDVGFFFSDEIFVVLKTFKRNAKIEYNIHFWIGKDKVDTKAEKDMKKSSPVLRIKLDIKMKIKGGPNDKIAKLLSVLKENAVVFREIEGSESPQFKQYFKVFGVHKGSLKDVFNPNDPSAFKPKLLHFHLNKLRNRTQMYEVPISWNSLSSKDVFIYDEGTKMTQWNGSQCDEEERQAARHYINSALKRRNCKATSEFYDEEDLFKKNELHNKLGDADVTPMSFKTEKKGFQKVMMRLSDQSGQLVLNHVYTGKIYREGINQDDVTFIEDLNLLYVYIGPGASANESLSVWVEAEKYLKSVGRPDKAIAVFSAGSYLPAFNEIWNDQRMQNHRRYM